jgi:hypothetical protein
MNASVAKNEQVELACSKFYAVDWVPRVKIHPPKEKKFSKIENSGSPARKSY